ncbi:MAG: ribosomal protein [Candidatus Midichloriaceae bacterium]|jgi:large subunit ribosomal protein L6|nr:ribosomal protein [Candidatus Midichloriaceae bacterium]
MSRVGKHPVMVPSGVTVNLSDGNIEIKGPKGSLKRDLHGDVIVKYENNQIMVQPKFDTASSRSLWGTTRMVLANMIKGVTEGFTKILEISGVGFKAAVSGNGQHLVLNLGFSHAIIYIPKDGVKITCSKPTQIEVVGIDKEVVGQTAAEIRAFKKPEPFKGKGIKYSTEKVFRKVGKKK